MRMINTVSLKIWRTGKLLWTDTLGQDLIEYALMAGFLAVVVGAVFPDIAGSANIIFSKVNSVMILSSSS